MGARRGFRYGLFLQKTMLGLGILAVSLFGITLFGDALLPQAAPRDTPVVSLPVPGIGTGREETTPELPEVTGPARVRAAIAAVDPASLAHVEDLKRNIYTVDSRTDLVEGDIQPEAFLGMDFTIDNTLDGPKVLIFHTHSTEWFADSDMSLGIQEGIYGVGERLKELLEWEYGIECLHYSGQFDVVDGKSQITGAYERMEPVIAQVLEENPSIQVVIDMHRDGVNGDTHLVTEVNGKPTAKIMFFNGLCRVNSNGTLEPAPGLSNAYLKENLAFSLQLHMAAQSLFPNYTRKAYLNAYRYSLHMAPRSLLIEVGAQTNTKEEAKNAMEPLAELLAGVLLPAEQ